MIAVPVEPSRSITHDVFTASRIDTWYVPEGNVVNVLDDCQVVPLMLYWYVPAPPVEPLTVIEPLLFPKQTDTGTATTVPAKTAGSAIVKEAVAV